jgi:hypothetical protein
MRTRFWLAGLLLVGMWLSGVPAQVQAAMWPFSLFGTKTPPVKKKKPGKPRPGTRPAAGFSR